MKPPPETCTPTPAHILPPLGVRGGACRKKAGAGARTVSDRVESETRWPEPGGPLSLHVLAQEQITPSASARAGPRFAKRCFAFGSCHWLLAQYVAATETEAVFKLTFRWYSELFASLRRNLHPARGAAGFFGDGSHGDFKKKTPPQNARL